MRFSSPVALLKKTSARTTLYQLQGTQMPITRGCRGERRESSFHWA